MSRVDSQSTTDENEEKDDATEPYADEPQNEDSIVSIQNAKEECVDTNDVFHAEPKHKSKKCDLLENWPHDRQPGWSQYSESSQNSQTSRVPSSLNVILTQEDPKPFDPTRDPKMSEVLIPETPESEQDGVKSENERQSDLIHHMSKEEREAQIRQITEFLEKFKYTVFKHEMKVGDHVRTMHLAFLMYDEPTSVPSTSDNGRPQTENA